MYVPEILVKNSTIFGIKHEEKYIAAIVLDKKQSSKYKKLKWEDKTGNPICIHRLAVHPEYQGKGIGKLMLKFADEYALAHGITSIRLDVYTDNPTAVNMYYKDGYHFIGEIKFPFRKSAYKCLEKVLKEKNDDN